MEWSYEKAFELITMFRKRPILWDIKCESYTDRQKRKDAILELADKFCVGKSEIERKWKNLQSQFYREVKSQELSWTNGRAVNRKTWFGYEAMKFLLFRSKPAKVKFTGNRTRKNAPLKRVVARAAPLPTEAENSNRRRKTVRARVNRSGKYQTRRVPRGSSARSRKNATTTYTMNDNASHVSFEANQEHDLDSEIECCDEKPSIVDNRDTIAPVIEIDDRTQQLQHIATQENSKQNPITSKQNPITSKQNYKVIPEDVIAPTIDFLLEETRTRDSNDSELNFYRSLIPDTMKLSDRRRRQFKEMVLCTLNNLLDEIESDRAGMKT